MAVQSTTIIGYIRSIVSVIDQPQQRERARKQSASVTKKLDMHFVFLTGDVLPEIIIIVPGYLLLLWDHYHHHLKIHQKLK